FIVRPHPRSTLFPYTTLFRSHAEIMRHLDVRDRGKKVANFAVLRLTAMPAVLTENLFIDHADDAKKLKSSAYIAVIARGHAEGRSEEHTSELQSRENLVCRLL